MARYWMTPWALTGHLQSDPLWPAVDLYESGDGLVVEAEVPGLSPEQVRVEVERKAVSVSGTRHYRQGHGTVEERFHRVIPLPFPVDPNTARAELRDGLLRVEMERRGRDHRRRIPVTTDESAATRP
jgi:HSP20 family protein